MKGTKRLRGKSWQLRAYSGVRDGVKLEISETIPPRKLADGTKEPVSEREADDELAKLVNRAIRLRDGGGIAAKKQKQKIITLREGFEAWLASARPHLEPNGADTDEDVLRLYVYPHLGDLELWRFRPDQLAAPGDADYDPDLVSMTAFYAMLAEKGTAGQRRVNRKTREVTIVGAGQPLGSEAIRRTHGTCRRAFAYCVARGWIRSNPCIGAKLPPKVKRAASTPAASALAAFVEFLLEDDPEVLCALDLMNSGARRCDMGLQWPEVSFAAEGGGAVTFGARGLITARDPVTKKAQVLVRTTPTKKRKLRTVALDAGPAARLMALRTHQEAKAALCGISLPTDAYVFSGAPDGSLPRHPGWFSTGFRDAKKRAAKAGIVLTGVRLYDIRHFMCSTMLAHGVAPAVVAERAGNSMRTMDSHYRHAVPAQDQAAADLMARIMREAGASKMT